MTKANMHRATALNLVENLLEKVPLIDGHNDLAKVILDDQLARGDVLTYGLNRLHLESDTDIPRLVEGKIGVQVLAAFTDSNCAKPSTRTLELIDVIDQIKVAHADAFMPVLRADDIEEAKRQNRIGAFAAVEGGVGLENRLAPLRVWYRAGVRLMTLCHNGTLDWVDSATDEPRSGGLSPFGRQVVAEMNRLGMMVDCAHVSADAMHDVLDVSTAPIVFSHSNARALCDHPRNVPDDVLDRLTATDGLVMATFIPDFVSEEVRRWMVPVRNLFGTAHTGDRLSIMAAYEREHGVRPRSRIEQVADHLEYIAGRIGPDRVGIGSDFYGVSINTIGLENVSCIKNLLVEMACRGWGEDNLAKLAGLNFIRIFRAVEQEAERLRDTTSQQHGAV